MGSKSRRKGKLFELEVAEELTRLLGRPVKRRLGQSREGGEDFIGTEPFTIEAKRRASLGVAAWFRQAEAAASRRGGGDWIPLVVVREDHGELLAVVRLSDLFGRLYAHFDERA